MFWTIIVVVVVLLILMTMQTSKQQDSINAQIIQLGYTLESKIQTGKYMGGHPDINEPLVKSAIYPKDGKLDIMLDNLLALPIKKGEIGYSAIKNILVEDQTTVERRVTVGRFLLTGIFAFAWKKKSKNELAYLTIEWSDGKFDHETIFQFEGTGSMQNANTARNSLIKLVR